MQAKMPNHEGHFGQFVAYNVAGEKLDDQYKDKKAPHRCIFDPKFGANG